MNLGSVTAAEVGEIKKELAYHDDVLTTAACIEGKCNEFRKRLLLSETVKNHLDTAFAENLELIGNIWLQGKEIPEFIDEVKNAVI